jgi:hypothetical protein
VKWLAFAAAALILAGCERLVSDIATRVRYALRDAAAELHSSSAEARVVTLTPNGWPDGCKSGARYRLTLSPYKGGKQVPAADIDVLCDGRNHSYTTGTRLLVARQMSVEKGPDEPVKITLRKTAKGIEIVGLE